MASTDIQVQNGDNIRKTVTATVVDKDAIKEAYTNVRDDKSDMNWAVFKFNGSELGVAATGTEFGEFKNQFEDDERAFAYIRVQTGDEISKRAKFLMVTWVGANVSAMKRAKMSTDKAFVKEILTNFAVELTLESANELDEQYFRDQLNKAAGTDYGTGIRN